MDDWLHYLGAEARLHIMTVGHVTGAAPHGRQEAESEDGTMHQVEPLKVCPQ